ncbi:uncharacterized protein LOC120330035 [Styela clava]
MSLLASFILTFLCVVGYCAQEHRSNISIMTMGREIEPGSGNSDNNVSLSSEIENVTSTKIDQYDSLTKRIKSLEQKEIEREKVKSCSPMPFVNICDMASLITKKLEKKQQTFQTILNVKQHVDQARKALKVQKVISDHQDKMVPRDVRELKEKVEHHVIVHDMMSWHTKFKSSKKLENYNC